MAWPSTVAATTGGTPRAIYLSTLRGIGTTRSRTDLRASIRSSMADTVSFRTLLQPYPLLAVISPWNFPFLLATVDAIPALLAGCSA